MGQTIVVATLSRQIGKLNSQRLSTISNIQKVGYSNYKSE